LVSGFSLVKAMMVTIEATEVKKNIRVIWTDNVSSVVRIFCLRVLKKERGAYDTGFHCKVRVRHSDL
jgi:predicted DNA-binding ribbon-helix-helix protein